MATLTVYPSLDGVVYHQLADLPWAALRDGAGTNADDSGANPSAPEIMSDGAQDEWFRLMRLILLFDTSALPDDATITGATLSIYGTGKADAGGWAPSMGIYSSLPASDNELVPGDYDSLGTTLLSSVIAYADFNTSGYNVFTLNATGLAAISKTGISKFGAREVTYDAGDSPPAWGADEEFYFWVYMSEQGTVYRPKLEITYTVPAVGRSFGFIIG